MELLKKLLKSSNKVKYICSGVVSLGLAAVIIVPISMNLNNQAADNEVKETAATLQQDRAITSTDPANAAEDEVIIKNVKAYFADSPEVLATLTDSSIQYDINKVRQDHEELNQQVVNNQVKEAAEVKVVDANNDAVAVQTSNGIEWLPWTDWRSFTTDYVVKEILEKNKIVAAALKNPIIKFYYNQFMNWYIDMIFGPQAEEGHTMTIEELSAQLDDLKDLMQKNMAGLATVVEESTLTNILNGFWNSSDTKLGYYWVTVINSALENNREKYKRNYGMYPEDDPDLTTYEDIVNNGAYQRELTEQLLEKEVALKIDRRYIFTYGLGVKAGADGYGLGSVDLTFDQSLIGMANSMTNQYMLTCGQTANGIFGVFKEVCRKNYWYEHQAADEMSKFQANIGGLFATYCTYELMSLDSRLELIDEQYLETGIYCPDDSIQGLRRTIASTIDDVEKTMDDNKCHSLTDEGYENVRHFWADGADIWLDANLATHDMEQDSGVNRKYDHDQKDKDYLYSEPGFGSGAGSGNMTIDLNWWRQRAYAGAYGKCIGQDEFNTMLNKAVVYDHKTKAPTTYTLADVLVTGNFNNYDSLPKDRVLFSCDMYNNYKYDENSGLSRAFRKNCMYTAEARLKGLKLDAEVYNKTIDKYLYDWNIWTYYYETEDIYIIPGDISRWTKSYGHTDSSDEAAKKLYDCVTLVKVAPPSN